jgi:hypothetical protein
VGARRAHIRLTQHDILAFCRDPDYTEPEWPRDYWPPDPEPPAPDAWDESITAMRRDRTELQKLVADPGVDLFAPTPTGNAGQTSLRAVLLAADHSGYHIGQIVSTRQGLGIWAPG